VIEVQALSKRFGTVEAVRDLSFEVADGEIFGLLGPNGAGKTTTVRMLAGLIGPSSGSAVVNGHAIGSGSQRIRAISGILTEAPGLHDRLTARDNLAFYGRLYGLTGSVLRRAVDRYLDVVGLRYVSDQTPGIRRRRAGRGFSYIGPDGETIRDRRLVRRIKALAIPPAWTDVWISPTRRGHIQATGRDAKGRKQYRYHPRWREVRDEVKYGRMVAFAQALPRIRKRTDADLRRRGLPRHKVLAAVVRLLEKTILRVGNDEYARDNNSFGLTTLRDRHARASERRILFRFRGKGGRQHEATIDDPRLARIVKRCQELPGQQLLQYVDDQGRAQEIDSADVNDYLREITGQPFSAKDFRTWAGTVLACMALQEFQAFETDGEARKNVVAAIRSVAARLGNTPAVCRSSYVHPAVLDAYLDGSMLESLRRRAAAEMADAGHQLRPAEAAVLGLLQARLARETRLSGAA
jgi:DNA topoisomerase I